MDRAGPQTRLVSAAGASHRSQPGLRVQLTAWSGARRRAARGFGLGCRCCQLRLELGNLVAVGCRGRERSRQLGLEVGFLLATRFDL
jgi:hypothetical protein